MSLSTLHTQEGTHAAAVLSVLSMSAALPVLAHQPATMPDMAMPTKPGVTPAEASMMSAIDKMSRDMAAVPMTGDADLDFAGMMILHHQGAIDVAKFELAHGKDPAMLKLAREVVCEQAWKRGSDSLSVQFG